MTPLQIKEFVDEKLREEFDLSDDSIHNHLAHLTSFYSFYSMMGEMWNPVPIAEETHINLNLSRGGRQWPEVSLAKMQNILNSIRTPQLKAVILLLLKTGIRIGELCNLDLRDVNLEHEGYRRTYLDDQHHAVELRDEIKNRPNTLYIDSEITNEEVHNGERRHDSNKRKVSTMVPIDEDLKKSLLYWLACRRDTPKQPANPLFLNPGKTIPQRVTREALKDHIVRRTEQEGQRLPPHFFRSYFTTMHRQNPDISDDRQPHQGSFPNSQLRYLRGDVMEEDMLERYTQQWTLRVKETYLENVYKFDVRY